MASSIASTIASTGVPLPRPGGRVPRSSKCHASFTSETSTSTAFKPPPGTISGAASEARAVLRLLREASQQNIACPKRVRIELPLPLVDLDPDVFAFAGLHGQASDWSGGLGQRFRVTKGLIDDYVLDGYENEYLGLLDRDADGMGVWRVGGGSEGEGGHDCTVVTHPADTTAGFFLKLLDGEYGKAVTKSNHLIVVVNAFWSGSGEKVGQPWEFGLREQAKQVLSVKDGGWEKVYCARRCRSASGVEGTLCRKWPEPWRLFNTEGVRVVLETNDEPSNRQIAEALNSDANVGDAAGYNRKGVDTSRDDDVIT